MNEIGAKIYYDILTGEVVFVTSEMQGYVTETTTEEDIKVYPQLQKYNANEIGCIQLQYGALSLLLKNVKSYSVNLITKKLNLVYYTQDELNQINTQKEQRAKTEQIITNSNQSIIDYLNLSESNLNDIENYILNKKQNEIIGGN